MATAAALQGGRALAAGVGRRAVKTLQVCLGSGGARDLAPGSRKQVHTSAYDKNPDEHVHGHNVLPDEVIQPQSDKYWSPHPNTGVFGPAELHGAAQDRHYRLNTSSSGGGSGGGSGSSALDQAAWFRPVDGVDKPNYS